MILFCDFNPKYVRKYECNNFLKNSRNNIINSKIYSQGNGVDMAIFAKNLGFESEVFLLKGTGVGNLIKDDLRKNKINMHTVDLKDENIEEIIIKTGKDETYLSTNSPRITMEDRTEIILNFAKAIEDKKIVCISKTDHELLDANFYERLIKICYNKNVKIAIGIEDISQLKEAKPYILMLDKESLSKEIDTNYESSFFKTMDSILNKGIGIVIVNSLYKTLVATKDNKFRLTYSQKKIANDENKNLKFKFNKNLMLAGFGFGIERDYDFETILKLSLSCAIFENFTKFNKIEMSFIKKLMQDIKIEKI